ncbi:MAG: ATP-binding protein, partial [Elusimicrobia bacterium]|nr:ATP-binding protein [Elusimicrobiota bacterium]
AQVERPIVEAVTNAIQAGSPLVSVSLASNGFEVVDQGQGMTLAEINQLLLVPKVSGQDGKADSIGLFGVGFFSLLQYLRDDDARSFIRVQTRGSDGILYEAAIRKRGGQFDVRVTRVTGDAAQAFNRRVGTGTGTWLSVAGNMPDRRVLSGALIRAFRYMTRSRVRIERGAVIRGDVNNPAAWRAVAPPRAGALTAYVSVDESPSVHGPEVVVTVQGVTVLQLPLRGKTAVPHSTVIDVPFKNAVPRARNDVELTPQVAEAFREFIRQIAREPNAELRQQLFNALVPLIAQLQLNNPDVRPQANLTEFLLQRWMETLPRDARIVPDRPESPQVEGALRVDPLLFATFVRSGRTLAFPTIEREGRTFYLVDRTAADQPDIHVEQVLDNEGQPIYLNFLARDAVPEGSAETAAVLIRARLFREQSVPAAGSARATAQRAQPATYRSPPVFYGLPGRERLPSAEENFPFESARIRILSRIVDIAFVARGYALTPFVLIGLFLAAPFVIAGYLLVYTMTLIFAVAEEWSTNGRPGVGRFFDLAVRLAFNDVPNMMAEAFGNPTLSAIPLSEAFDERRLDRESQTRAAAESAAWNGGLVNSPNRVRFSLSVLPQVPGIFGGTAPADWRDLMNRLRSVGSRTVNALGVRHMVGALRASVQSQNIDPFLFGRENVQNSLDGARQAGRAGAALEVTARRISDSADGSNLRFVFRDNIGMSPETVIRDLLIPGLSTKEDPAELIGMFGQGFFSNLKGSNRVVVVSSRGDGVSMYVTLQPVRDAAGVLVDIEVEVAAVEEYRPAGTDIVIDRRSDDPARDVEKLQATLRESASLVDPTVLRVGFDREWMNPAGLSESARVARFDTPDGPLTLYRRYGNAPTIITHRQLFLRRSVAGQDDFLGLAGLPQPLLDALNAGGWVVDLPPGLRLVADRSDVIDRNGALQRLNGPLTAVAFIAAASQAGVGQNRGNVLPYDYASRPRATSARIRADAQAVVEGRAGDVDWSRYVGRDHSGLTEAGQNLVLTLPIFARGTDRLSLRDLATIVRDFRRQPDQLEARLEGLPFDVRDFYQ